MAGDEDEVFMTFKSQRYGKDKRTEFNCNIAYVNNNKLYG